MARVKTTKQLYEEINVNVQLHHYMNVGNDIIKAVRDYPEASSDDIAWMFAKAFHDMIWDFCDKVIIK